MLNTEILKRILQENAGKLPETLNHILYALFPLQNEEVDTLLLIHANGTFNRLIAEPQLDFNVLQKYSQQLTEHISEPLLYLNTWIIAWQAYLAQPVPVGKPFINTLVNLLVAQNWQELLMFLLEISRELSGNEPILAHYIVFYQALAYFHTGDFSAAALALLLAQAFDPQNAVFLYYSGECYAQLNETDLAIQAFENAALFNPLFAAKTQAPLAALLATQTLNYETDADNINRWLQAIRRAYYAADYPTTRQLCTDVIAHFHILPLTAEAYYYRALANMQSVGEFSQSLQDYTQAISLMPENNMYYTARGQVYATQKNYSAARADFEKALHISPDDDQALQGLETLPTA